MQKDVVDVEGNMVSSGKIKLKVENFDKKKKKEEDLPKLPLLILKI
jgi:hypothetical protein